MYLLYNIFLSLLALPFFIFQFLVMFMRGKTRRRTRERFGFYADGRCSALKDRKILWIHAISVGETRTVVPLVKALKKRFPEYALVLSNVTETGHKVAEGVAEIDLCLYFPYDFSFTVERVFRRVKPALVAIVETEIWPNFVRTANRHGIPVILVNGRISDRSFPRYRRLRFFLEPILQQFTLLGMQSSLDAERIVAMGAPAERVEVIRNLKFDMQAEGVDRLETEDIRRDFRLPEDCRVWVAASTHAGEEELVLEVHSRLLRDRRDLALILVPRHPERCRAVGELLSSRQIPFVLRSEIEREASPLMGGTVLLVDSVGEVLKFYAVAELVFVGGSLVPVGGHNVLEASLMGKPVLFGPYMHNFKEIARLLLAVGGGVSVAGADELYKQVAALLAEPEKGRSMGDRGYSLLQENRGAAERTLKVIEGILENR